MFHCFRIDAKPDYTTLLGRYLVNLIRSSLHYNNNDDTLLRSSILTETSRNIEHCFDVWLSARLAIAIQFVYVVGFAIQA